MSLLCVRKNAIARCFTSFPVNIVYCIHAIFTSHFLVCFLNVLQIFRCLYVSRMESRAVSMFAHVVNIMNLVGSA